MNNNKLHNIKNDLNLKPQKIKLRNKILNNFILNNKSYDKISGPISFHILKPKESMSKYKLPLIIVLY